jgi:F-type H+-transporting ATPase subunit gamma
MDAKEIKRAIESVRNIWKLTGALETLAALKMKKAQKIALLSRPFSEKIAQILKEIDYCRLEEKNIFFDKLTGNQKNKVLAMVLASDKGFCGSFNQNVLKFSEKMIKEMKKEKEVDILPVGKKSIFYFRERKYKLVQNFSGIGDFVEIEDVKMISDFLVNVFLQNKYQEIHLFYTNFISTFLQKPKSIKLLPLDANYLREFCRLEQEASPKKEKDFLIEPSRSQLFEEIVPQLVEYLIYQAVLEGNASEHSARMMAMRNASENAQEKVGELNLVYNKARQEQITNEVCEVSSAKEVLG